MAQRKSKKKDLAAVEVNTFISFPDLKASYFIVDGPKDVAMMVRLDEGRYKNVILKIGNFNFGDDNKTNELFFDYELIYNPYKKELNTSHLTRMVKMIAKKLIDMISKSIRDMEMEMSENDSGSSDSKKSNS